MLEGGQATQGAPCQLSTGRDQSGREQSTSFLSFCGCEAIHLACTVSHMKLVLEGYSQRQRASCYVAAIATNHKKKKKAALRPLLSGVSKLLRTEVAAPLQSGKIWSSVAVAALWLVEGLACLDLRSSH